MDFTVDSNCETVICTPQPRACSTENKKTTSSGRTYVQQSRVEDAEVSNDSLGVLALNDLSMASNVAGPSQLELQYPVLNDKSLDTTGKINEILRINRMKAIALAKEYDKYLSASRSRPNTADRSVTAESTVFETDLLKQTKMSNGTPSYRHSLRPEMTTTVSNDLLQLADNIRNTDMSIRDIFEKYRVTNSTFNEDVELDSAMFTPGELVVDQLNAAEMSWREESGIPASRRKSEFLVPNITQCEKMSMGEFFKGKSENCSIIFNKESPQKGAPMRLVDSTLQEASNSSKYSSANDSNFTSASNFKFSSASDSQYGSANVSKFSSTKNFKLDDYTISSLSQLHDIIINENGTPSKAMQFLEDYKRSIESRNTNGSLGGVLKESKQYYSTNSLCAEVEEFCRPTLLNSQSMHCISESNKENRGQNTVDRSLSSLRSTSSMDILPESKLPIECTKVELVWGCVKLGKQVSHSFVLRNKCGSRFRFQMSVTNPSYKLTNIDAEPISTAIIVLHPNESRKFTVSFMPMAIGASVGKLLFHPMVKGEVHKDNRQLIMMYGYGGHASMDIQNISKDSTGKLWLSLGNIDSTLTLTKKFVVRNSGNLPGFAWFSALSKTLCSFTNITIKPSEVVLKPGQQANIDVSYVPTKQDYKHIRTNFNIGVEVFEIAQVKMVSGAEIIRGRLRRLSNRLKGDSMQVENVIQYLSRPFENEMISANELRYFKESVGASKELRHQLVNKDVSLTIEQDLEKTVIPGMGLYETSMFQTLSSNLSTVTTLDPNTWNRSSSNCLIVEASTIILTPPSKIMDNIVLSSDSMAGARYQITMAPLGLITLGHVTGTIDPGETKMIPVACAKKKYDETCAVNVQILADDNIFNVNVKIINVPQ